MEKTLKKLSGRQNPMLADSMPISLFWLMEIKFCFSQKVKMGHLGIPTIQNPTLGMKYSLTRMINSQSCGKQSSLIVNTENKNYKRLLSEKATFSILTIQTTDLSSNHECSFYNLYYVLVVENHLPYTPFCSPQASWTDKQKGIQVFQNYYTVR